jgi:NAD-dependent dihydropyrimidine dehydrogenase PreA subunit
MKRAVTNYFVDVAIGLAFLVAAVSSIVFLLPSSWVSVSSAGQTSLVGVDMATWSFLHKWSGIAMIGGVVLHTLLHTRWIVTMTRRVVGGRPQARPRPSGAVAGAGQGAMAASVPSVPAYRATAGETRPRATVAPQPGPARTMPAAPLEATRPVPPGTSTERASARTRGDGAGGGDEPRRFTRKTFLGAAATAVAGAAVIGVALSGSGTDVATEQSSTSSSSSSDQSLAEDGQVAQSQASGSSSTGDSAAGASGTQQTAARVVVDGDRCSGCGHCLQTCPQGVFAFDSSSGAAVASSPDSCTLCGRCVQVCRPQAITLNA